MVYEKVKECTKECIFGGIGGIAAAFIGFPFDTLKVRLHNDSAGMYKGLMDVAIKSVKRDGFLSLYKGLAAPLVAQPPMFALYFLGFGVGSEICKIVPRLHREDGSIDSYLPAIAFAGAFSAIPGTIAMVPGDRIKIILQLQAEEVAKGVKPKYSGSFDCFLKVSAEEGLVRGMYRGFFITLLRDVPATMAWYGAYFGFKELAKREDGSYSTLGLLNAGGAAGIAAWTTAQPLDVIKTRYQKAGGDQYPGGVTEVAKKLVAEEGIVGFFRGVYPSLLRAYPATAVLFYTADICRSLTAEL